MARTIDNWSAFPNFTESEFRCKHTGRANMHPDFMRRLQQVRGMLNRPMVITSGYRDPSHPLEAKKKKPGEHTTGRAADVAIQGPDALRLIHFAVMCGFTRVGVHQKGRSRFIHLGDSPDFPGGVWTY